MFSKKNTGLTIVGVGTTFEGNLTVSGGLQVDGRIEGGLRASGDISVGPEGVITGDVTGRNLTVSGVVEGCIEVEGHLCILGGGTVRQDVSYGTLEVRTGGKLLGRTVTQAAEAERTDARVEDDPIEDVNELELSSVAPVGHA